MNYFVGWVGKAYYVIWHSGEAKNISIDSRFSANPPNVCRKIREIGLVENLFGYFFIER